MKKCKLCLIEKEETFFNSKKVNKDGLYSYCKECARKQSREFYSRNPEPYKNRAKIQKKKLRAKKTQFISSLRAKYGCALCSERDLEVLDFHHFNPIEKEFHIGSSSDTIITRFIKEVNKCVILCANCHRRVHAGTRILKENMKCNESIPPRLDGKNRMS